MASLFHRTSTAFSVVKRLVPALTALSVLLLPACAKELSEETPVTKTQKQYVLASFYNLLNNQPNGRVTSYTFDPTTGLLTEASFQQVSGLNPRGLAATSDGKYVYVAAYGGKIYGFTLTASTGALALISASGYSAAVGMTRMAVTADNKFLYGVSESEKRLYAYSIDSATGALTSVTDISTVYTPKELAIHPSLNRLYVAVQDDGGQSPSNRMYLYDFSLNSGTGAPTGNSTSGPAGDPTYPLDVVYHAKTESLYAVCASGKVIRYPINATTGAPEMPSSITVAPAPEHLVFHPSLDVAYLTSFSYGAVPYALSSSGAAFTEGTPANTESNLGYGYGIGLSSNGGLLFAGDTSGGIAVFSTHSTTGALTHLTTRTLPSDSQTGTGVALQDFITVAVEY